MNLKERLNQIEVKTFADPVHYSPWNSSGSRFVKKSDNEFLKKYAHIQREGPRNKEDFPEEYETINEYLKEEFSLTLEEFDQIEQEVKDLTEWEYNKMFMFADAHLETVINDETFADDGLIVKERLKEYELLGPRIDGEGKYLFRAGDHSELLDFAGNKVETVDYKFIDSNWEWIDEVRVPVRSFQISTENGNGADVAVYNKKARGIIKSIEDEDDRAKYFNEDDEIRREILFVADLDSNSEIRGKISEYVREDEEFQEEEWVEIKEFSGWGKVKSENPLNFKLRLEK